MVAKVTSPSKEAIDVVKEMGGDLFRLCYQCGLCSGVCPTSYAMPHTPRQVAHMLHMGLEKQVLDSKTHWLCVSCYSCTTYCPRDVPLTDIMSGLKRADLALGKRSGKSGRFYRAYMDTVRRHGRLHEAEFVLRYIGADVFELGRQARLGRALLSHGKVPLRAAEMEGKKAVEAMFRKAEEMGATS
jgi:heterodisulfide reductase subunit C